MTYALIMAGGGGTRLWPYSRLQQPKQFVDLFGGQTLLQRSFNRIEPLVSAEHTFVVTGARYADLVRAQLPTLPAANLIIEPARRNTAAAAGLGATHIRRRDPDATMIILTADHLIRKDERFRQALQSAAEIAQNYTLVTLGITPSGPATGFGYIERADHIGSFNSFDAYRVQRFTEKPDLATAVAFFASEKYDWNSGMFICRADRLMAEFARQQPSLHQALEQIGAALGTPQAGETIERVWHGLASISLDYAIVEGAERVAVLPVEIGWSDVGSWAALYDEQTEAPGANVVQEDGELIAIDTQGCLIHSNKMVTTVGLRDLVVVDTDDVLMICPRDRTQQVRNLVDALKAQDREEYL